ncbi:hypothetical protein LLI25_003705 [Acinetobacter baumannii]|nr:hypothetical protein [Acinetobacter baumannii]EKU8084915.1 hypothetical protein [Acinetobacter baumannii]
MKSIDYFKKRKRLNKQITPKRAHVLISKFPEDAIALIYDVTYKKFLLMGDTGELNTWSSSSGKWIPCSISQHEPKLYWTFDSLKEIAKKYEYKVGDLVVYCGLDFRNESVTYKVIGFESSDRVIVCDTENDVIGSFYMDNWRLATTPEQLIRKRIFN